MNNLPQASPQLTQDGYQRLEQLLERQRARMDEAREYVRDQMEANEAENLGLVEAQEQLAILENQVAEIEYLLSNAKVITVQVITQDASEQGRVMLGSTALLTDLTSGRTLRVRLVSPLEAGGVIDGVTQITQASPVGAQLEGRRKGDTFQVQIGARTMQYQVTELELSL